MKKIAFFDTKPYDRTWFDILAKHYEIAYFEEKLNRHTATLTDGFDAVCAFVNDRVDAAAIDRMHRCGVQLLGRAVLLYTALGRRALRLHVAEENTAAVSFYRKAGFETLSWENNSLGRLLLMEKKLEGRSHA